MKSRWHTNSGEEQNSPIEMRFVDMFMTALGALVFVALLLVFLLPKVETSKANRAIEDVTTKYQQSQQEIERLKTEIARLTRQLPQGGAPLDTRSADVDIDTVRRWFGVLLLTSSCNFEPELYARWEGKIVSTLTNQRFDAEPFDSSNPVSKTVLFGDKYLDVGDSALEPLSKNGLNAKLFFTVSPAVGSASIYVGFRDPSDRGARSCTIHPVYLSSRGLVTGEKITLTQQRPYAWLRRFKLNADGSTTLGTLPRDDDEFKRDIVEFSRKQSQLLCQKTQKKTCSTIDAHCAVLVSVPACSAITPDQLKVGEPFKNCEDVCPWMVAVPAGSFVMGAPASEAEHEKNEEPQHRVTFAKPFAVGQYAVTFAQWDACVAAGGCRGYRPDNNGWDGGTRPVINVSWNDARAYVAWLSQKTGQRYRLPTEAEREYVTRAGKQDPFWFGDKISTDRANYDGNISSVYNVDKGGSTQYREKTVPVDSFEPNPWKLYQVHGNVYEWTEDCFEMYRDAPGDGSAVNPPACPERVLRGGSWRNRATFLRAAYRIKSAPDTRRDNFGFRVARD